MAKTTTVAFDLLARDKASPVFDKFGRRVRDTAKSTSLLQRAGVGLIKTFAGYTAIRSATNFLKDANAEAREAQKVGKLTANVIKTTGGAANVTAGHVEKLANSISLKTGKDDEAIQSGANLLLTFKKIKQAGTGTAAVFDRATKAAVDLSASGFGDINTTSKQLGKALQDPIKGVTALGRAGVTFSQSQKDNIEKMVEQNNLLGAQKLILREVESQVKGSAEAQATAGDKAAVAYANMKEQIGTALLPAVDAFSNAFIKKGVPAAEKLSTWITQKGIPGAKDLGATLKPLASSTLPLISTSLGTATQALKLITPAVDAAVSAFNKLPDSAQKVTLLAGAVYLLQRRLAGGAVASTLLSLGSAGLTGGGNAGKGAKGFTLLSTSLKKLGVIGAGAAVFSAAANAIDETKRSAEAANFSVKNLVYSHDQLGRASASTYATMKKGLEQTNVGKHAERLGIDLDKLSRSLVDSGTKGKYYQQVVKQLGHTSGQTGGFLNGLRQGADQATLGLTGLDSAEAKAALANLLKVGGAADKAGNSMILMGRKVNQTRNQLILSAAGINKYRNELMTLPTAAVTQIATPGFTDSYKNVIKLANQYDLTPKEVRTIMKAMDFATKDIKKVLRYMGIVDRSRANPQVHVGGGAVATLSNISQRLRSLDGKTVRTFVQVKESRATGGPIFGRGGPKADKVPIMASAGEHMLTAADVDALGGHAGVFALRRSLHSPRQLADGGSTTGPITPTAAPPVLGGGRVELSDRSIDRLAKAIVRASQSTRPRNGEFRQAIAGGR